LSLEGVEGIGCDGGGVDTINTSIRDRQDRWVGTLSQTIQSWMAIQDSSWNSTIAIATTIMTTVPMTKKLHKGCEPAAQDPQITQVVRWLEWHGYDNNR